MSRFTTNTLRSALFASALCASMPAAAHHSSAPHFDRSKTVVKEGVFTQIKLVNPHAYIYFDVTEGGETNNWRCELSSASQLKRLGWSEDTFKPGDKFTMSGSPAWREDHVCVLGTITLPNGTEISRNTNLTGSTVSSYVTAADEKVDFAARAPYLPNGQPNISGNWRTVSFGRGAALAGERENANSYDLSAAGKAATQGYEMAFDDPILRCHYVNLIKAWNHDAHTNQIEQTDDKVILRYGFMDVTRTVHLDQDSHPETLVPSDTGHSIGRWDGDTLIVDTIGFEAGVLEHSSGVKHSDQLHAEERFYIDPKNNFLMRDSTLTDPLYLISPKTASDGQELVNLPLENYNCTELSGVNNIRPGDTVTYKNGTGITSNDEVNVTDSGANAGPKMSANKQVTQKNGNKWLIIFGDLAAVIAGGGLLMRGKKG